MVQHSHRGPDIDQRATEIASAMAIALGKFSDDKWREGDWLMELVLTVRKFADALVRDEFHAQIVGMLNDMPWTHPPVEDGSQNVVAPTWEYQKAGGQ